MSYANEIRQYTMLDMIHLLRVSEERGGHAAKHTIGDTEGTWAESSMMTNQEFWGGRRTRQIISDSTMFASPYQHSAYLSIEDHAEVLFFILVRSEIGVFLMQEIDKGATVRMFGDLPSGMDKRIKQYRSGNWSYSRAYSHFLMLKPDGHKLVIHTSYPSDTSFDELRAALFTGHVGACVYVNSSGSGGNAHYYCNSWYERPIVIADYQPADIKGLGANFREHTSRIERHTTG